MKTTAKAVLVVASLVALASAGAAGVRAAGTDTIGATVQTRVYIEDSRALSVRNSSTLTTRFTFNADGGWIVEPQTVEVEPDEVATVHVLGDGEDGASVTVTVEAVQRDATGDHSILAFTSLVYHEAPFDLGRFVGGLIPYLAIAAGAGWLLWRLKPWQIRLTRTTR